MWDFAFEVTKIEMSGYLKQSYKCNDDHTNVWAFDGMAGEACVRIPAVVPQSHCPYRMSLVKFSAA